jgi:hypothetical protein
LRFVRGVLAPATAIAAVRHAIQIRVLVRTITAALAGRALVWIVGALVVRASVGRQRVQLDTNATARDGRHDGDQAHDP